MFSRSKKNTDAIAIMQAELASLRDELSAYADQLSSEHTVRLEIADRLSALEGRVSGMGTELSRQLHELSDDIEQMSNATDPHATEVALTALRTSQARLANEQARYEIAFRQDLASLADQLRLKR
jgi:predicted  nucleic acid-binding Zn-ribbon protein